MGAEEFCRDGGELRMKKRDRTGERTWAPPMSILPSKASFRGDGCSGRGIIWNPDGCACAWSAGDVGKTGVYRGESSISLLETKSKSRGVGPGLDMQDIGTGVLALSGKKTLSEATCALRSVRRKVPRRPRVAEEAVPGGGRRTGLKR